MKNKATKKEMFAIIKELNNSDEMIEFRKFARFTRMCNLILEISPMSRAESIILGYSLTFENGMLQYLPDNWSPDMFIDAVKSIANESMTKYPDDEQIIALMFPVEAIGEAKIEHLFPIGTVQKLRDLYNTANK